MAVHVPWGLRWPPEEFMSEHDLHVVPGIEQGAWSDWNDDE